jgi:hypothetical protein
LAITRQALAGGSQYVSLKGKRDRAIFATLLYHILQREELCKLSVKDFNTNVMMSHPPSTPDRLDLAAGAGA